MGDLAKKLDLEGAEDSQAQALGLEGAEPARAPAPVRQPARPAETDTAMDTAADTGVGLVSGASFEFDDEIKGGLAGISALMMNLGGGQGLDKARSEARKEYRLSRDKYRERKALAERRSPVANTLGKVGGAVASSLVIPGGAATGAAKGGMTALRLGAEGAAAGVGASEAESAGGLARDAAAGAGTGLLLGKAAQGALRGGGAMLQGGKRLAGRLAESAERSQVAATGQSLKQAAKLPGGVSESASVLKKHKIGGAFAGKAKIQEQAQAAAEALEGQREQLSRQFHKQGVQVDGKHIARLLRDKAAGLAPKPQWMEKVLASEAEDIAAAKTAAGRLRADKIRAKAARPGVDVAEGLEAEAAGKTAAGRIRGKGLRAKAADATDADDLMAMARGAEAGAERQAGRLRQRAVGPGSRTAGELEAVARGAEAQAKKQAAKIRDPGEPVRIESQVNKGQRDLLEREAQYFESRGRMSFAEANQARKQWMENVNFASDAQQAQGGRAIHQALNHAMENAANGVIGGSGKAFRDAGREMAHVIAAGRGAENAMLGSAQRQPVDAFDVGMAAFGGVKGMAASGARGFLRGRGHSMRGAVEETTSRVLGRAAPGMAQAGRAAQAAAPAAGAAAGRLGAEQGAERVKEAFLTGGEEAAAQAHYLESMTNPLYRSQTDINR